MDFDIIVIGGGHAGCEAAYAASKMGQSVLLLALRQNCIANLPCNCSIGGPGKSHLVREIAALGGALPQIADLTVTHRRLLNTGKGPAVHALRVQVDKDLYPKLMLEFLKSQANITIMEAEVTDILTADNRFIGVKTVTGEHISGRAGIITTGTFLNGVTFIGDKTKAEGRYGEPPATKLSSSLKSIGFELGRLKTGTTPRLKADTIDYSVCGLQPSDNIWRTFQFDWQDPVIPNRDLLPCHLTYTTEETHRIIRDNLHRSALYGGLIVGRGPRYCPSIEDKVVRFADRDRHQIFLEREGWESNTVYPMGISTSLPEDVQELFVRSVQGLENVEILRYGYAVEYDFINPNQIKSTLETKHLFGLFSAGQINGTSGYEEAAAQGLLAGVNAALYLKNQPLFVPVREQGYLGVMIDDLVTKEITEPYRLLTSRAEYRLLFRQDNADNRFTFAAHSLGIISDEHFILFKEKSDQIKNEIKRMYTSTPKDVNLPNSTVHNIAEWLRRPEVSYNDLRAYDGKTTEISYWVGAEVEVSIKYDGYIKRETERIKNKGNLEKKIIPEEFDYAFVKGLSNETLYHLDRVRPRTVGQAARIAGITPADILLLEIHLDRYRSEKGNLY